MRNLPILRFMKIPTYQIQTNNPMGNFEMYVMLYAYYFSAATIIEINPNLNILVSLNIQHFLVWKFSFLLVVLFGSWFIDPACSASYRPHHACRTLIHMHRHTYTHNAHVILIWQMNHTTLSLCSQCVVVVFLYVMFAQRHIQHKIYIIVVLRTPIHLRIVCYATPCAHSMLLQTNEH